MNALYPKSVNPGSVAVAPMTTRTSSIAEFVAHTPHDRGTRDLSITSYTQITGAASQAAFAPDGSLWVLSTGPSGPDKYIYRYDGTWKNIPGLASRIATAPDSSIYAINSGGGLYHYA